jgi:hypothetical protein
MDLLSFNFDELLGLFLGFICLLYLTIVVFNGFMKILENFIGSKMKRLFHYHYHYRDRRK